MVVHTRPAFALARSHHALHFTATEYQVEQSLGGQMNFLNPLEKVHLLASHICDFTFLSTSLPSTEAIYDAICSVMGGMINPNMAANDL